MGQLTTPGSSVSAAHRGRYVQNVWPDQPKWLRETFLSNIIVNRSDWRRGSCPCSPAF